MQTFFNEWQSPGFPFRHVEEMGSRKSWKSGKSETVSYEDYYPVLYSSLGKFLSELILRSFDYGRGF